MDNQIRFLAQPVRQAYCLLLVVSFIQTEQSCGSAALALDNQLPQVRTSAAATFVNDKYD